MGQIGKYLNGRAFKEVDWKTSGRPIIRIQNLTGSGKAFNYYQGDVEPRYLVQDGDLLFSWAATLGTYIWHGPEAVLNQHIFKVESKINPKFHRYLLEHSIQEMQSKTHGSGMVHITKSEFDKIEVAVPPIDEQQRMVEALDDHLSRLDKALADVEAVYRSSNLLRMSALEKSLNVGFPTVRLENLVVGSGYGTSTKCVAGGLGVPVARIPNLVNGSIDMTDEKRVLDLTVDLKNLMLAPGDVLVIRTNGSQNLVGTTAVVPENINASFASYLIRFQVDRSKVYPEWLHFMFGSRGVRKQIVELSASSAGQYNLGLSKLNSIEIPLPSIQDQKKILEEMSLVTTLIDSVQREREVLLTKIETLKKSILKEAFSGGLQNA